MKLENEKQLQELKIKEAMIKNMGKTNSEDSAKLMFSILQQTQMPINPNSFNMTNMNYPTNNSM